MTAASIRAGLYELRGLRHCGDQDLRVERTGSGEFTWEVFCLGCAGCDPNGYRTLREAIAETPGYWAKGAEGSS
jgi:hypothetical protein